MYECKTDCIEGIAKNPLEPLSISMWAIANTLFFASETLRCEALHPSAKAAYVWRFIYVIRCQDLLYLSRLMVHGY